MNYYIGTRQRLRCSEAAVEQLRMRLEEKGVLLTVLGARADEWTIGVVQSLEAWNPPVEPFMGAPLVSRGGAGAPPAGALPARWDWEAWVRSMNLEAVLPEVGRELGLELSPLGGPGELFMHWGRAPSQWMLDHAPWSLLVGFATFRKEVLRQKKVQQGLASAGFTVGTYTGALVFGRCVGKLAANEVELALNLESQLPAIQRTMADFLAGPGKKLASSSFAPEELQGFLCFSERANS